MMDFMHIFDLHDKQNSALFLSLFFLFPSIHFPRQSPPIIINFKFRFLPFSKKSSAYSFHYDVRFISGSEYGLFYSGHGSVVDLY